MLVGCKLLRSDGSSLRKEGRVFYPMGEWITVPGNGAYVAVTGGLVMGGSGPLLTYMECEDPTGAEAPVGVACYRRVRRLAEPAPEKVSPDMRGQIARYVPDLSPKQRAALAEASTPDWRGAVARYAPGLTPKQRIALAKASTADWRGRVAYTAPGLSPKQRIALAEASAPEWRGAVACFALGLSAEQRVALAEASTPEWRGRVARDAPGLTPKQRAALKIAYGYE